MVWRGIGVSCPEVSVVAVIAGLAGIAAIASNSGNASNQGEADLSGGGISASVRGSC